MKIVEVPLSNGGVALVSEIDYPRVSPFTWHQTHGYARRVLPRAGGRTRNQYMHVFILGKLPGMEIDHENGNGLHNNRENISHKTHPANLRNSHRHRAGTIKGFSWHKQKQKWRAHTQINGKQIHIGLFDSAAKAKKAHEEFISKAITNG